MRRFAYVLASILGLGLLGCGVPEYRIQVEGIPQDTVQLQVATYVQGAIATDSPTFAVVGPLDSYTFGLDLPAVPEGEATISVAARAADGCLLAVGTRSAVPITTAGSNAELPLAVPLPAVAPEVCRAAPQTILAVLRSQEGPLSTVKFSLLVQGWGFQPTAAVEIRSTVSVRCATGSACNSACDACADPSNNCRTNCTVTTAAADIVRSGPALIEVNLDPFANVLQQGSRTGNTFVQPIDLLQLLSQPLQIMVTNPGQPPLTFVETAMIKASP